MNSKLIYALLAELMNSSEEEINKDKTNVNEVVTNNSVLKGIENLIGQYVIIRTRNEGLNCGFLESADETGCVLTKARRIYKSISKDKTLSWYEGVSVSGLCEKDGIISGIVDKKIIIEDYSITTVSLVAQSNLENFISNKTTY